MEPVSKLLENTRGIESPYLNIKSCCWENSDNSTINCSHLLFCFAFADITRQEKYINDLILEFGKILVKCKNQEDYGKLSKFMNEVAALGGYAKEFNDQVKDLINEEGKEKLQQYIIDVKKNELADFNEKYARLNRKLKDIKENSIKNDEEVASLLKQYNLLQSDLYNFNGIVDKEFIIQFDEQIEEAIDYLKRTYRVMEDIKDTAMRF